MLFKKSAGIEFNMKVMPRSLIANERGGNELSYIGIILAVLAHHRSSRGLELVHLVGRLPVVA